MAVTTIPVDVGSAPGDGTGDPARTGGQSINTSIANLDAATEYLQSAGWVLDNTSETLAYGEKVLSTSHAGITKTLPAAQALTATGFNDIWIYNADTADDITVALNVADTLYEGGSTTSSPATTTIPAGWIGIFVSRGAGLMQAFQIPSGTLRLSNLADIGTSTATSGNILLANGTSWNTSTKEAADIVDRLTPALETTPYLKHETRAARSSGTETINCEDDPSVYLPIGGNSVTIALTVPTLSLPVRGLDDVKLAGKVFVKMNGAYSGLTVTTNAGTKLATFPKGTAPAASGEYAVLVWEWFDDGTTDFMWAEWVNDD